VSAAGPDTIVVQLPPRRFRLKLLDAGVVAALLRLADGQASRGELDQIAARTLPAADLSRLDIELGRLACRSLVHYSCVVSGRELLRAIPTSVLACFRFTDLPPSARLRLSRFAYMRRLGDASVLDSPASHVHVTLGQPFLGSLLAACSASRGLAEITTMVPGADSAEVRAAAAFLHGVGVLAVADQNGATAEDSSCSVAQREFHDVAFHAASRNGLTASATGGTYRFKTCIPPTPVLKPAPAGPSVALPRPDLKRIMHDDPPLGQVMEARRSLREHGDLPITVGQLGEFLYRVGRIKTVRKVGEGAGRAYEVSSRTYPSGGATYDLELYVTVRDCTGLGPGVYYYDALGHQLTLICERADMVRKVLLNACRASATPTPPQAVITMASRFNRVSWKYESIAYSVTLKNAGVLYEAMYLAATAMNLAGCGLGSGDSALFSLITGLDPLAESSVGEFMLGTPRLAEVSP
jgi:SagB-type dehydrogenase family enzyme